MTILTLVVLLSIEGMFFTWSILTKQTHSEEKGVVNLSILFLFGILVYSGVFVWSFRYIMLFLLLIAQSAYSIFVLLKRGKREYSIGKSIICLVSKITLILVSLLPLFLFPQYQELPLSGTYDIDTSKYTWIDNSRRDTFSGSEDKRALTVEFWYPADSNEKYPLVVFSHGAFGFSGSNYSTFAELASNGYIVASIGHTHHAFYTIDTSGKLTTVDQNSLKRATEINAVIDSQGEEDIYNTTKEWMKLRTEDMNFVLDTILLECENEVTDRFFGNIDPDKIGVIGHSLGGAAAAQIGRERSDIDAAIVLDGTMLGEEIGFENGKVVLNPEPYPIPLLNLYAEDHYTLSKELVGDDYDNHYASNRAICSYDIVFRGAGHLNFTDLPLFSPILANTLGIGAVDPRYCIENTNRIVLTFFDGYLKYNCAPDLKGEY